MNKLLLAIYFLSRELVFIMHEFPSLKERIIPHQIKIRQILAELVGNTDLANKRYDDEKSV